jgi:hypothetical protein
MPTVRARRVLRKHTAAAAVVLSVVLAGASVTGCEYTYDDGRGPLPSQGVPSFTEGMRSRDPERNRPVTGAALDEWVAQVLPPDAAGQIFHTGFGSLAASGTITESTVQLPSGTYSLTLACRSFRRVTFSIRDTALTLVDLSIRCGSSRVNVVHLSSDSPLTFRMDALADANFAYRVSRI